MSESNVKLIRKQIKNVVQGLLPSLLTSELMEAVYKRLSADMGARMDVIAKGAQETLKNIDDRQKDFQSMLLRSAAANSPEVPADAIPANEIGQVEKGPA